MWKMRCDTVYAPTAQNIEDQVNNNRTTIKAIYAVKPALDQIDQQILNQPIATIMGLPLNRMKTWIKQTDTFVRQALVRSKRRAKISTNSIRNFFHPVPQQQHDTINSRPKRQEEAQMHPTNSPRDDLRPP
jgi:hypothetical protein